jgi:hypothetical protein
MRRLSVIALTVLVCLTVTAEEKKGTETAVNRVRYYPAPGAEKAMVGGKISSGNVANRGR